MNDKQTHFLKQTSFRQYCQLTKVVYCCLIFELILLFVEIVLFYVGVDDCLGLFLLKEHLLSGRDYARYAAGK